MKRTTEKSRRKSISAMKDDKRLKRKVRNSYIVSTVSITLVLFLLGSVGYLMVAAMKVTPPLVTTEPPRLNTPGTAMPSGA